MKFYEDTKVMIKIFKFFIYLILIVFPIVWISNYPGQVKIIWRNYFIETNVIGLLVVLFSILVTTTFVYMVYNKIIAIPEKFRFKKREKNLKLAKKSLSRLANSIVKNDSRDIEVQARLISKYLDDQTFSSFIISQNALKDKDYKKAEKFLNLLSKLEEGKFIAYKNFAQIFIEKGQNKKALDFLKKAKEVDSKNLWVSENLSVLLAKEEKWIEAAKVLDQSKHTNSKLLSKKVGFLIESGLDPSEMYKISYDSIPAATKFIEFNIKNNNIKKALLTLEKCWPRHRYLKMIEQFLYPKNNNKVALQRYKSIHKVIKSDLNSDETKFALALVAAEAKLWGKANYFLQMIDKKNIDERIFNLWLKLKKNSKNIVIPQLSEKLPKPPLWKCLVCNSEFKDWNMKCKECGSIDSIQWPKSYNFKKKKIKIDQEIF